MIQEIDSNHSPKKPKKSLSVRQQKYKKYRLQGMTKMAAALAAGYSRNTATQAHRIEKYLNFDTYLELAGLTDAKLAKHAAEGLEATKVISANITYGDADEKTNDFIDVPDWANRHKYLETILKVKGKLGPTDSSSSSATNIQVNFNLADVKGLDGEEIIEVSSSKAEAGGELPSFTEAVVGFEELTRPEGT